MAFQILLNVCLAFLWMFLSGRLNPNGFVIGFLLGALAIFMMRRFFKGRLYLERLWAVLKLTLLFFKELVLANIAVFKVVLRPKLDMQPAFFKYETALTEEWELTLLSSLITLTPGTVVVHISDNNQSLYIHAIDAADIDETIDSIRNSFERAIMEVSRS